MINPRFYVDSFRPWDMPRGKPPSSHDHPSPLRYPTPTSITDFPLTPAAPINPARHSPSQSSLAAQNRRHQHPLPARPPPEVCASIRSSSRASERTVFSSSRGNRVASTSPSTESCLNGPEPISRERPLSRASCASRANNGHNQSEDRDVGDLPTRSPSILDDAVDEVARLPGSVMIHEDVPQLPESQDIIPIDPAILYGVATHEAIRLGVTVDCQEAIDDGRETARSSPGPLSLDLCPVHGHDHQGNQSSCDNTVSIVTGSNKVDTAAGNDEEGPISKKRQSRTRQSSSRPSKRSRTDSAPEDSGGSFLTLRSHFLTSQFEERLQFLSWLFESTLARCMSESPATLHASSKPDKTGTEAMQPDSPRARRHRAAPTFDGNDEPPLNPRKGRQWTSKEIDLLVTLRKERNLSWSKVTKLFTETFPGRSRGAIQVYWSTKLKSKQ